MNKLLAYAVAGADGIQFDKLGVEELIKAVDYLRIQFPNILILAAGRINGTNITDYAKTNVNGIVTTSLYCAKPIEIGIKIE